MLKHIRDENSFIRRFFKLFLKNELTSAASEMAYSLIFAFFPLLMVIHASFSMVFNEFNIEETFFYSMLPRMIEELLDTYIEHISGNSNLSFLILGILLTLYTLTRFMKSMKRTVRRIYGSKNSRKPLAETGISMAFSVLLIAAFHVSLILLILGGQILDFIESHFTGISIIEIKTLSRFIFTSAIIFSVVLLFYYWIPNVYHKARHFIPGTLFASASWVLVSGIFSFYMNNFSNYSVIYGSIGAFIMLLIWIYMSCLILLIGACINAVLYLKDCEVK